MLFFTSDTHFGHLFTLTRRKRPFASLAAMDAQMIARWNETVAPGDEVYHLGDVAHLEHPDIAGLLGRLNGRVHLLLGNNDDRAALEATGRFASISELLNLAVEGQNIFLCHYPLREWPNDWRGAWHLFGHVHGKHDSNPHGLSLDIGVDSHGYRPISLAEVAQKMAALASHPPGRGAAETPLTLSLSP
jgi:calcineurin-like phosphoesterase family protein